MKVGILTFHNAYIYGAILQTYATQEKLKVTAMRWHNKAINKACDKGKLNFKNLPKRKFWQIPAFFLEIILSDKMVPAIKNILNR